MTLPSYLKPTSTLGAGVIVFHEGHVLLVQMNYGKFNGHWIQPGGKVDPGEHPEQAAIREVREETGLDVEISDLIGFRHRIRPQGEPADVYFLFRAKLKSPGLPPLKWPKEELIEARFWKLEEALALPNLRPMSKLVIRWALELKPGGILPATLPQDWEFDDAVYLARS